MKRFLCLNFLLILLSSCLMFGCSPAAGSAGDDKTGDVPIAYRNGFAVTRSPSQYDKSCIIDEEGNELAAFVENPSCKIKYLNNGNIYFSSISLDDVSDDSADFHSYMFCKSSGELVEMPFPAFDYISKIDYSDGLLLVYSSDTDYYGVTYYDGDGNCVLELDGSNENYKKVTWASGFENNEAAVFFTGQDENNYKVTIDKSGNWLSEPMKKNEIRRFGNYDLVYDNPFN